jgi:hypothetical protein
MLGFSKEQGTFGMFPEIDSIAMGKNAPEKRDKVL